MKIKFFCTAAITAIALSFVLIASADGVRKRVKFAKGKTSATVSGALLRGDRDIYTVGAKAGQLMSVRITSTEENAVFQIQKTGGEFLDGAAEGEDATEWSGALPENGDYEIIVGGTRGNATYKMTVSIK